MQRWFATFQVVQDLHLRSESDHFHPRSASAWLWRSWLGWHHGRPPRHLATKNNVYKQRFWPPTWKRTWGSDTFWQPTKLLPWVSFAFNYLDRYTLKIGCLLIIMRFFCFLQPISLMLQPFFSNKNDAQQKRIGHTSIRPISFGNCVTSVIRPPLVNPCRCEGWVHGGGSWLGQLGWFQELGFIICWRERSSNEIFGWWIFAIFFVFISTCFAWEQWWWARKIQLKYFAISVFE